VFPALVENRRPEDPIRIWVPGCATGEEAYSIAICLMEFLDDAKLSVPFGSSPPISANGDRSSPRGRVQGLRVGQCLPETIGPVLHQDGRRYQVAKSHTRRVRFCPAQRGQDPPFSKLDLISCCNVLIYLGAVLQRKVLSILHYSLKPTGFLALGPSESIGTLSDSFDHVEKTTRSIACDGLRTGRSRA